MGTSKLTRRHVLKAGAAAGLVAVTGCVKGMLPLFGGVVVYKRSGRGLRISNAAKKNNANKLYATMAAAMNDPAHPGDISKVVPITIPAALAAQLFPLGKVQADLRHDL
jgi:hypothetical protein